MKSTLTDPTFVVDLFANVNMPVCLWCSPIHHSSLTPISQLSCYGAISLNPNGVLINMKSINMFRGLITAIFLTVAALPVSAADHKMDIVDTAINANMFQTLVTAVSAAGLVEVLKGDGPFTVFAPTDEAFSKLPGGTIESLLKPENIEQLVSVLTYHVIPGKVLSSDIPMGSTQVSSVQGSAVMIKKSGGTVSVNQATVVQADVEATNGVIHIIDEVILPN